jgi:hypothetical protein
VSLRGGLGGDVAQWQKAYCGATKGGRGREGGEEID